MRRGEGSWLSPFKSAPRFLTPFDMFPTEMSGSLRKVGALGSLLAPEKLTALQAREPPLPAPSPPTSCYCPSHVTRGLRPRSLSAPSPLFPTPHAPQPPAWRPAPRGAVAVNKPPATALPEPGWGTSGGVTLLGKGLSPCGLRSLPFRVQDRERTALPRHGGQDEKRGCLSEVERQCPPHPQVRLLPHPPLCSLLPSE